MQVCVFCMLRKNQMRVYIFVGIHTLEVLDWGACAISITHRMVIELHAMIPHIS